MLTLIIFIEKIEEEHIKSVYNPTFSAILDIALIVFALYLAFSPMVRSRRKAERLPEYKSRKELQTQIILIVFVLAALCNIFFFVMIEYLMLSNGGFTETSALNITQNVLIFINVSLLVYVALFYIVIRMFERGVTKPIKNLSKSVDNFVKNGLTVPPEVNSRRLSYEIATLGNSFEKMSGDIINYIEKIKADDLEISRTRANMEAAARIQQGILPEIPKNGRFDISSFIKPALTMGGDFYDVISLDKDRLLLCIGDVSSKGLPAAVFMVETGMLVKSSKHCSPEKILTNINTVLCENNSENMFVSLFVGIIDTADMTFAFSNAGHNYPVLWRGGKPLRLDTPPEIVLGVTDFEYTLHTVDIDSDFRLLLYTDGVTEAENSVGELYGDSRLDAICKKITSENNSDDTIEILLESIKGFAEKAPQSDDITILTVRIKK